MNYVYEYGQWYCPRCQQYPYAAQQAPQQQAQYQCNHKPVRTRVRRQEYGSKIIIEYEKKC